jgi:CheY-like chemotaxis protein
MEHAKVLLIEDAPHFQMLVGMMLEGSGHEVCDTAETRESALEKLKLINERKLNCNVVILDGNLSGHRTNGEDAQIIAKCIHDLGLPVRIIGFSASFMHEYNVKVDADVRKEGASQLVDIIDELPEPDAA